MRKQTKVAAVVSAAALLAIGASMTSFAKGWTQEDGEWVWLDSDGERVYGEWKKDGSVYFWLDEETGEMATNRIVEDETDTYYVGANGARVANAWVPVDNEDGYTVNGEEPATVYYYMGSNGKAYKNTGDKQFVKKSIDGVNYFFDADGIMQYGWVEYGEDIYYCGTEEQGWSYKGWLYAETENIPELDDEHEDEEWVYLDGGKLVRGKTKYIDKHYYSFDDCGVLETYWHNSVTATAAGLASGAEAYAYDAGVAAGVLSDGWVEADVNEDGEYKWYYMVTVREGKNVARAIPFNQGGDKYAAKLIGGKTYLFDADGKMQTGLKVLGAIDSDDEGEYATSGAGFQNISSKRLAPGTYFFAKSSEGSTKKGQMMTGKITNVDDGEEYNYYFDKNGMALKNTIKDNVIYGDDGVRIQAEDGNSYEKVLIKKDIFDTKNVKVIAAGSEVVVSSTGKIRTSKTITIDGEKYNIVVNKGGVWEVNPAPEK